METQEMWEGVLHAKLPGATADQAWSILQDFYGLHKLLPGVETCTRVDGAGAGANHGLPGCMRRCVGAPIPSEGGQFTVPWATERLLSIDPDGRSYSYEVAESNMGFRRYIATIKALPESGDSGDSGGKGCTLEWSFTADPVEGWTRDGLASYIENGLQAMAKRIEEAVKSESRSSQ